jgi:hypothetical protein
MAIILPLRWSAIRAPPSRPMVSARRVRARCAPHQGRFTSKAASGRAIAGHRRAGRACYRRRRARARPPPRPIRREPGGGFGFDGRPATVGRASAPPHPHGVIDTPAFVAVGTQAAVKGRRPRGGRGDRHAGAVREHLPPLPAPGADLVAAHGGLHRFMGWDRPILTDSGGFQVFSLGASIEHRVGKVANIFPGEAGAARRARARRACRAPAARWSGRRGRGPLRQPRRRQPPRVHAREEHRRAARARRRRDPRLRRVHQPAARRGVHRASMHRTHRWAERCLDAFDRAPRGTATRRRSTAWCRAGRSRGCGARAPP